MKHGRVVALLVPLVLPMICREASCSSRPEAEEVLSVLDFSSASSLHHLHIDLSSRPGAHRRQDDGI